MAVANNVLIADKVPDNVTLPVPLVVKVTPVPAATLIVPWVTAKVTDIAPVPASTSAICKPLMAVGISSAKVCAPGTVLVGALFTAVTVKATVLVAVKAPPVPVLPPSLVVMVSVSLPL